MKKKFFIDFLLSLLIVLTLFVYITSSWGVYGVVPMGSFHPIFLKMHSFFWRPQDIWYLNPK